MNPVAQLDQRRPPPTSATEALLLGALFDSEDPQALLDTWGLRASLLVDPRVQICWDLIEKLAPRKKHCDAATIFSAARASNKLVDADLAWLNGLQGENNLEGSRAAQVAEEYRKVALCRTVREQMVKKVADLDQFGLRPAELQTWAADLGQQVQTDYAPDANASGDLLELIHEWDNPEEAGHPLIVPTHIAKLDEILGGGFVPSFNCIVGDPGIGKSGVIGSIIEAQVEHGMKVGLAGLEEGHRWMTRRLLAKRMGLKIGDIGRKKKTMEEDEKLVDIAGALHPLLENVQVYPFSGVSIDALLLRIAKWAANGVQIVYIDHMGEIRHRSAGGGGQESNNWAVAESYRRLRDLGRRLCIPIVGLAHRKTDARDRPGPPAPPRPNDVGLTGEAEKMIRLMLGLWRKNGQLRGTTIKNNEGPSASNSETVTVEFEFIHEAGLATATGGTIIDLAAERRAEASNRKAAKREEADEKKLHDLKKRQEWRDAQQAKKEREKLQKAGKPIVSAAPPLPPQLTLLEGGEKPAEPPPEPPPPQDPRE